ncbi:MAG: pseudouridine synthase [Planctomycetota bacterium]|jgi:23S rRNA pseudouridine2605 synthase
MMQRLQKVLAHCGVGSRRECEEIIEQGRVEVNGQVVTRLGTKVDPEHDGIRVDGEQVAMERRVYYLLHKPRGYICTNRDERGRPRVIDLIPDDRRIYTVGRLDEASEGLVLLTNDGALANIVCHPRYQVDKTYRLEVRGRIDPRQLDRIERGVWLAEGKSAPARVRRVDRKGDRNVITLSVWEGRNRELRRIFAKVALRVTRLTRTAIGPLRIDGLDIGAYRRADQRELAFARERMRDDWKPQPVAPPEGRRWAERLGRERAPRRSR